MPLLIRNARHRHRRLPLPRPTSTSKTRPSRASAQNLEAPPGTEVIDATGKLVFPGFIDPHVHIYLPFMATFAKDTHETGSIAALVGGTTTYIEMCCPIAARRCARRLSALEIESRRQQRLRLHLPHVGDQVRRRRPKASLREIVADGISFLQDLPRLQELLRRRRWRDVSDASVWPRSWASSSPRIAKTPSSSARLQQQPASPQGKTGPEWHEPSRPESVEAEGTNRFATFLENTGAAGYVVHLSCEPALERGPRRKVTRRTHLGRIRAAASSCSTRPTPNAPASKA